MAVRNITFKLTHFNGKLDFKFSGFQRVLRPIPSSQVSGLNNGIDPTTATTLRWLMVTGKLAGKQKPAAAGCDSFNTKIYGESRRIEICILTSFTPVNKPRPSASLPRFSGGLNAAKNLPPSLLFFLRRFSLLLVVPSSVGVAGGATRWW